LTDNNLPISLERRRPTPVPSDIHLQRANPNLWKWYDGLFPDKRHPLVSKVAHELYRRWSYLCAPPAAVWPDYVPSSAQGQAERIQGYWLANLALYQRLHSEVAELASLIFRPVTPQQRAKAIRQKLSRLRQADVSYNVGKKLEALLKQSFSGRPTAKRGLALLALERQIQNPRLLWKDIAGQLNYAGNEKYQNPVAQVLPAEVRVVKRILRKYGILDDRRV
jgi:hypothetical protein